MIVYIRKRLPKGSRMIADWSKREPIGVCPQENGNERSLLPRGMMLALRGDVLLIYRPRDGVRMGGIVEHGGRWYGRTRFRKGGMPHGPFRERDEALRVVLAEMRMGLMEAV